MKYSALPLRLDSGAAGDVTVPTLFSLTNEGNPYLAVAREQGSYRVRVHGVADFVIGSTEVVGQPSSGCSIEEVRATFELDVRPVLHQLDGCPAVHASAVANASGAIAFVGPSCAGKSTIAALMSKVAGFRLVSDDCLPLELEGDTVVATPTAHSVRLRVAAAETLGKTQTMQFSKYVVPRDAATRAQRLRAIYALKKSDAVAITPMSHREGMAFVAGHLQRLDPSDPELLRREFDFVATVVERVQVATLWYPHTFECLQIADAIEEHLARP